MELDKLLKKLNKDRKPSKQCIKFMNKAQEILDEITKKMTKDELCTLYFYKMGLIKVIEEGVVEMEIPHGTR